MYGVKNISFNTDCRPIVNQELRLNVINVSHLSL